MGHRFRTPTQSGKSLFGTPVRWLLWPILLLSALKILEVFQQGQHNLGVAL